MSAAALRDKRSAHDVVSVALLEALEAPSLTRDEELANAHRATSKPWTPIYLLLLVILPFIIPSSKPRHFDASHVHPMCGTRGSTHAQPGDSVRKHVLVVESDAVERNALIHELAGFGWTVDGASSAGEAMACVRARPPRAAIVALRLSDGSGLSLLSDLFIVAPTTAVVLMSNQFSTETCVAAVRLGAHSVLEKPVRADALVRLLSDPPAQKPLRLDQLEAIHIRRVLAQNDGNKAKTARALGISKRGLDYKLKKTI